MRSKVKRDSQDPVVGDKKGSVGVKILQCTLESPCPTPVGKGIGSPSTLASGPQVRRPGRGGTDFSRDTPPSSRGPPWPFCVAPKFVWPGEGSLNLSPIFSSTA